MPFTQTIRPRPLPDQPQSLPPDLHPVLRRVYLARRVSDSGQLQRSLKGLHPYHDLRGIEAAVDLLEQALARGRRIVIVADYDADGATSCATAVRGLRAMGAAYVGFVVPDRMVHGYGLSPELVDLAAEQRPDLLVTVDNGIASIAGVRAAKARGIQVLVTDHHLPGSELPEADAIVNPNQDGDVFPSKHLAGVGVIFYVLTALRSRLRRTGWLAERPEPNLAELLDLVALGTVADVVPLDHTNRILVAQGLARIRRGRVCPGIAALCEAAGRSPHNLVSSDLGFFLGPRLNAAGRMDDMTVGIACLLADDFEAALAIARELDRLNRERRQVEGRMQEQAQGILEGLGLDRPDTLPWGLCLYGPEWHEGVVGLLASRIKDRLHRPVVALAPAGGGEARDRQVKGSARSVPGLHLRDALAAVAARHPGLLSKFGGHAMAAGMTLPATNLQRFAQAFDAEVRQRLQAHDLEGVILSDGELGPADLNLELAEALRNGGPWGQGFPEPVFDGVFEVLDWRIVGTKHLKLRLGLNGARSPIDAIAFNTTDEQLPPGSDRIRIAYRLDVNEYRGSRTAQLLVSHIEPG